MRRPRSKLPPLFAGIVFVVSAFGCNIRHPLDIDLETSPASPLTVEHSSKVDTQLSADPFEELSEVIDRPGSAGQKSDAVAGSTSGLLATTEQTLPSPGRTNAFEFGSATGFADLDQTAAARQLRVIGFVDAGQPSVMLVIDGKTHVLSATQSFDHVTVQSIKPPLVQVTNHGSHQTLSLFDR